MIDAEADFRLFLDDFAILSAKTIRFDYRLSQLIDINLL